MLRTSRPSIASKRLYKPTQQHLQRLQANAQGATGQMAAIQYANQLASNQANQLLQLRALLIAQQTADATRNQVLADREAQQQAADQSWRKDTLTPVTHSNWTLQ